MIYLDNAATTMPTDEVVKAVTNYYRLYHANPGRGATKRQADAAALYEQARQTVADFIGAADSSQIVFTRNATEAINIVANHYRGSTAAVSVMEHHSNLLPWKAHCYVNFMGCDSNGKVQVQYDMKKRPAIIAINHMSNVIGSTQPVKQIAEMVHQYGTEVLCDGTQAVAHTPVNVTDLGVDYYVFSGHKIYAPMGIGVLYVKDTSKPIEPLNFGGGTVENVTEYETDYLPFPYCLEAGTQNIGGAIGLKAAIEGLNYNHLKLCEKLHNGLKGIDGVQIVGNDNKSPLVSFTVNRLHAHDVATFLEDKEIIVNAGYHCAQPLHHYLKLKPTVRVSLGMKNTEEDINKFLEAMYDLRQFIVETL